MRRSNPFKTQIFKKSTPQPKSNILPEFKLTILGLKQRPGSPKHYTKLGGKPDWIQSDETPICKGCRRPMAFVSQIDSLECHGENAKGWMFGDSGTIYTFICIQDDCDNWDRPISLLQYY